MGKICQILDAQPERRWRDTRGAHPLGPVGSPGWGGGGRGEGGSIAAGGWNEVPLKHGAVLVLKTPSWDLANSREDPVICGFSLFLPLLVQHTWDHPGSSELNKKKKNT